MNSGSLSLRHTAVTHVRAYASILFVGALLSGASMQAQEVLATHAQRALSTPAQPGDLVAVKVYREPDLSDTVTVDADGAIVLARIGVLNVAKLPIGVLADTLRARYAKFLRKPDVELSVLRRIVVNGEVARPNVYYVDVITTLRDVIARAGGVTDAGDDARLDVIRHGVRVRVANWQDDTTLASELDSGDQIVVNRKSWFSRNAFSALSAVAVVVSLYISLRR